MLALMMFDALVMLGVLMMIHVVMMGRSVEVRRQIGVRCGPPGGCGYLLRRGFVANGCGFVVNDSWCNSHFGTIHGLVVTHRLLPQVPAVTNIVSFRSIPGNLTTRCHNRPGSAILA